MDSPEDEVRSNEDVKNRKKYLKMDDWSSMLSIFAIVQRDILREETAPSYTFPFFEI